jgi:hypothetical protein
MVSFTQNVQHVKFGEPGKAGTVARPDQQLDANIQFLKDLVDGALLGEALFIRDATVEANALVGQPVYFNNTTQQYERAIAAVAEDPTTGVLVAADSADVAGVIFSKTNSTLADILVLGFAALDISNAVDGTPTAGRYYLSAAEAGKLVAQRPGVTVTVLRLDTAGNVLVVPDMKDFLEDHIHFQFDLAAVPAGTHDPPAVGDPHIIDTPNPAIRGWLPANHSSFSGKAPGNAIWGYNLPLDPALNRQWPPIPLSAASVIWDKGEDLSGGTDVPLGIKGLVTLDANGIWWNSNCYGDVPWPTGLSTSSSQSSSADVCPRDEVMRIKLLFSRQTYATDKSVVTKIESDSPLLTVLNCDGDPASTGDLKLNLLLNLLVTDTDELGSQVLKTFNDSTLTFNRGRVIEGLLAGSNVSLSSANTRLLDPANPASATVYQGIPTLNVLSDPTGSELSVELFRLDDVRERFNGLVSYLAFVSDQTSAVIGKIKIPPAGLATPPTVKIRAVFIGTTVGTPPAIVLKTTAVPRPSGTPALPTTQVTQTFNVPSAGAIAANDYFEIESTAFSVTAGDSLFFEMSRVGNDGYTGEIGILRMGAVLQ